MSFNANGNNVFLGRGKLFFNRLTTAGVATGFKMLGEVSKFEVSTEDDVLEIRDHTDPTTPVLKKVVRQRDTKIALTFHEVDKENIALAVMGSVSSYTQTVTAVVAESLTTSVVKGHSYKTVNRQINTVVVKKGATVLVLGTDYDIADAATGLIHIKETSVTVVDGDALTIDYAKPAIVAPGLARVVIGNASFIEGAMLYIGNPTAGPAADVEIWKVSLTADGVLALIQDEFAAIDLSGVVLSDTAGHPTEPIGIIQYKA